MHASPLLQRIASFRSLEAALFRAARGKRHRPSVGRALLEAGPLCLRLERELLAGTWAPGEPQLHEIFDPKRRTIAAAPFADRIVHQALCAEVGPMLERGLIAHSFACRTGLGTHAAVRLARLWAAEYRYVLHLDVAKFFPSLDHAVLEAQLARDLRGFPDVLALCMRIVEGGRAFAGGTRFHFPGDDLFAPLARRTGLPIGNLTSQHFANRYLSPVDHLAKDRLRVHAYLRYMDDMLLFGHDREALREVGRRLEDRCHALRLRLHPWQVRPVRDGFGWLGFRIFPAGLVRVKRSSVARAEKRLATLREGLAEGSVSIDELLMSVRSTFAHWEHADSHRLRTRTLEKLGMLAERVGGQGDDDP
jgi:hypothetical protein